VKLGEGKRQVAVPEKDWVRVERPELRIVPEQLWKAVQRRKAEMFKRYERTAKGRLQGRPEMSLDAKHLLAGFCVCSQCGGRLVVSSPRGKRANRYLVCWRHRSSKGVCSNGWNVPLQPLTDAIVKHFTEGVLTAEAIAQVQADLTADADSSPERVAARRQEIEREIAALDGRIGNWIDALGDGGSKALAERIKEAEAQKEALQIRLAQLDETQATMAKWTEAGQRERVEQLLGDWQAALQGAPEVGRRILRKLLVGPILVRSWVDAETRKVAHSYEAQGTYGKALSGTLARWGFFAPEDEHGTGQRDELRAELLDLVKGLPTPVGPGGAG
jgi:site-specific DNA recombinase